MDWEIQREIGSGSFGKVYEITRDNLGQIETAALKVISIPHSSEEILTLQNEGYDVESIGKHYKDCLEEIIREYSLMAKMKGHSNVVNCDDLRYVRHADGIGWDIFIRMELLTPLEAALTREYDEEQTVRIAKDICTALSLCGKMNIVHRDVKPQNIFVSSAGSYKLGDFGVAKVSERTAKGTIAGTYDYMAPEIIRGNPYGASADVYSLGIVLYWLMNGHRMPFLTGGGTVPSPQEREDARYRRFAGEALPAPAYGSPALKRIVLKACAFDPSIRYASANEMLYDLEHMETHATIPVYLPPQNTPRTEDPISTNQNPDSRRRKNKSGGIIALLTILVLLAAGAISYFTVHFWQEADCTMPKTCRICGKEQGEPLEHRLREATCTEPAICRICDEVLEDELGHDPENVLCTEAQICSRCGEVLREAGEHQLEGNSCTEADVCVVCGYSVPAAGHQMGAPTCTEAAVCLVCGYTEGTAAGHDWVSSTCTEPKTCAECFATEGSALGHVWIPASCSEPETCSTCGAIQGDLLAHEWTAATELLPETCSRCGETQGTSIPIPITDCVWVEDSNPDGKATDIVSGDWADCEGNVYKNALRFWTCNRVGWENTEHVVYALNGAYETMAGSIAAESSCEIGARSMIRIYLDGSLAYASTYMDRSFGKTTFTLDVTGVNEVRIENYCDTFQFAYCLIQAELYNS